MEGAVDASTPIPELNVLMTYGQRGGIALKSELGTLWEPHCLCGLTARFTL